QACAAALERGRGAIVLVPEIALTPQTLGRFRARFGDRVALLHSGLTDAERRDERERIAAGDARVVVGARSAIFAPLRDVGELGGVEERGGRAILLLNRRGIAPALHCRACGTTLRCPHCDVALVLHADERLRCHHCGHSEAGPSACPACGSVELARIGAGTQRLERELVSKLPRLVPIRLDADTTQKPDALAAALRRFAETERAVLLGTQMVAKGHHFAGVSLAAVIDADTGLGVPDFRADERTFQLLTQ